MHCDRRSWAMFGGFIRRGPGTNALVAIHPSLGSQPTYGAGQRSNEPRLIVAKQNKQLQILDAGMWRGVKSILVDSEVN